MAFNRRSALLAIVAVAAGLAIALVDSRPTWDDSGVTAFALLGIAGAVAFVARHRPWLWALLVGLWVPLLEIGGAAGSGSLVALAFAFAGAGCGHAIARWVVVDQTVSARR